MLFFPLAEEAFFAGDVEDFLVGVLALGPRLAGDLVSLLLPLAGDFRLGEERELEVDRLAGEVDLVLVAFLVGEADFDLDFDLEEAAFLVSVFAFFLEGEVLERPREGDFDFDLVVVVVVDVVFFLSLVPTVPAFLEFLVCLFGLFRFTEELVERFTGDLERVSPNN